MQSRHHKLVAKAKVSPVSKKYIGKVYHKTWSMSILYPKLPKFRTKKIKFKEKFTFDEIKPLQNSFYRCIIYSDIFYLIIPFIFHNRSVL